MIKCKRTQISVRTNTLYVDRFIVNSFWINWILFTLTVCFVFVSILDFSVTRCDVMTYWRLFSDEIWLCKGVFLHLNRSGPSQIITNSSAATDFRLPLSICHEHVEDFRSNVGFHVYISFQQSRLLREKVSDNALYECLRCRCNWQCRPEDS